MPGVRVAGASRTRPRPRAIREDEKKPSRVCGWRRNVMDNKFLTYRGEVRALVAAGESLAFVPGHPEGQPTALYRLDVDKLQLKAELMPCGGVALAAADEAVWVLGTDGRVYRTPPLGKGGDSSAPRSAEPIALLSNERIAVMGGSEVAILARKDAKVLQKLLLPEEGSALAADPTGQWLVAGTTKGDVLVFESEDRGTFELSA